MGAFVGRASAGPREAAAWTAGRILANNLRSVIGRAFPRIRSLARELVRTRPPMAMPARMLIRCIGAVK